jgi:hypothetical protein
MARINQAGEHSAEFMSHASRTYAGKIVGKKWRKDNVIRFNIVSFTDPTGKYTSLQTALFSALGKTAATLSDWIVGYDTTIDVAVTVDPSLTSVARGGPASFSYKIGETLIKGPVQSKIQTGVDNSLGTADANLAVSTGLASALISPTKTGYNIDEVLLHEMFHAAGISGFADLVSGAISGSLKTWFDAATQIENGKPYFIGATATAILGTRVPLIALGQSSAIYHVDEKAMPSLAGDLMGPQATLSEKESTLDFAILKDLGYSLGKSLVSYDGHTFIPGANTDTVSGTVGLDRVIYSGAKAGYDITTFGGTITVKNKANPADTDTLSNIERVQFSGTAIAFDDRGQGGEAYRLYKAAFDRSPDSQGLGYWMNKLQTGTALTDVANGFINSDEFKMKYGANTSNIDFVTLLYKNVLHRGPDAGGLSYWLGSLEKGMSREQVLLGFSDSPENKGQVILNADGHEAQAYRMYQAAFDRTPDLAGLTHWIEALDNGMTLTNVAQNFIGSPEFTTLYGTNPTNRDFVTKLYYNVLDRAPDATGLNSWEGALSAGLMTKAQVLQGFSESPENRANLELIGVIKNGFEFTPAG